MTKFFRNEYRVRPSLDGRYYCADVRRWWLPVWDFLCLDLDQKKVEAACRRHAGEGTIYLGKLP